MTIAVQHYGANGRSGSAGTSLITTWSGTPTNGNRLLGIGACHLTLSTKHVTPPVGWTTEYHADAEGWCVKLISKTASSEGGTVTITFADGGGSTTSAECFLTVAEINGQLVSFQSLQLASHANPHTIPTVTPSSGIEALMIAITFNADPYNVTTFPTLYTLLSNFTTGADARVGLYYQHAASTTGTYGDTYNLAGNAIDFNFQAIYIAAPVPTADFTVDDNSGPAPFPVVFTDLSFGGTVTAWAWDFGDDDTSTSQNPSHTYVGSGTYTVSLTATIDGSDYTETKVAYIVVSDNTSLPPPPPGGAIVEIYTNEAGAYRWDDATWDDATWSASGWQDVTPESINATVLWGSSRPELGILSQPDAESWSFDIYDPDRILDPANASGPWYGTLKPGLPIRINHSASLLAGTTIRTGIVESMGHDFRNPGTGYIRATNAQATYANAAVPHDTSLSDTLYTRAADAIAAAGLPSDNLLTAVTGDPALVAWADPGSDLKVWDWIADAAQSVLWVPYFDRHGRLGFREYAAPSNRSIVLAAPELISLASIVQYNGNYSRVIVHDSADVEVIHHVSTDYGTRTFTRTNLTPDAEDWADAVIADRAFDSLRWVPGDVYPLSAASLNRYVRITAIELVNISHAFTSPIVDVNAIVVGGEIRVTARQLEAADWRVIFHTTQSVALPLAVSGTTNPVEYVTRTGGADTEYLFPSQ